MRPVAALTLAFVLAGECPLRAQEDAPPPDNSLESAAAAVDPWFDEHEALALVKELDPFFRTRGNQGYIRALEACYRVAKAAGFDTPGRSSPGGDLVEFRDFGPVKPSWTPRSASLEVYNPAAGVLHSFDTENGLERTFVCVNSFPTPPEGVIAPLVEYENSKPVESYAGTIVYGTLPAEELFARAVQQGGALGVISGYLPSYNQPELHRDAIRYATVPYDAERKGFGLNVSTNKRELLERLLDGGMVYVRVRIDVLLDEARSRTLVMTLKGTEEHAGQIAIVAHIDEPGTNDNATGAATTTVMAAGLLRAIQTGALPRPRRTMTFLLGTEFECSREWLRSISQDVDLALIIDMVGQDFDQNGALPLVERMPDPGAIWDRPPLDVHSQWGRGDVRQADLEGSFLNDYVMAAMAVRARSVGWPVRTNPYEGGSDHESFLDRGIPAVLLWHFTDPYYHTNLDRFGQVSAAEMANVGVATMSLLSHFGQAGTDRAREVLDLIVEAARLRLRTEASNGALFLSTVAEDPARRALVSDRERTILAAWSKWYREAVRSVEGFEPTFERGDRDQHLEAALDDALEQLGRLEQEALATLGA